MASQRDSDRHMRSKFVEFDLELCMKADYFVSHSTIIWLQELLKTFTIDMFLLFWYFRGKTYVMLTSILFILSSEWNQGCFWLLKQSNGQSELKPLTKQILTLFFYISRINVYLIWYWNRFSGSFCSFEGWRNHYRSNLKRGY